MAKITGATTSIKWRGKKMHLAFNLGAAPPQSYLDGMKKRGYKVIVRQSGPSLWNVYTSPAYTAFIRKGT